MTTSVVFVLPGRSGRVSGGYRMVYEYAERLAARDFRVTVLFLEGIVMRPRGGWRGRLGLHSAPPTPDLQGVDRQVADHVTGTWFDRHDVVVTTSWHTAQAVRDAGVDPARVVGFVQGLETWSTDRETLERTWHTGTRQIAVSTWLANELRSSGCADVSVVPNPVGDPFVSAGGLGGTRHHDLAFLWNPLAPKGGNTALAVAAFLLERDPTWSIWSFSAYDRPDDLPSGVRFVGELAPAELARQLVDTTIFLSTSRSEGWSLTCTEALACGCALAATDIPGVADYARHGETALLAPVDDVAGLASACSALRADPELTGRLNASAREEVQRFSWSSAVDRFADVLVAGRVAA